MIKSLKKLFDRKSTKTTAQPTPNVGKMTFDQLVAHTKGLRENIPLRFSIDMLRRFQEIAYHDNHVTMEGRREALILSEALKKDIEARLAAHPGELDVFRNAQAASGAIYRRLGIGSLSWKLREEHISNADTLPFIVRPEHSHLVADFLEIMKPEVVVGIKHSLVRQLILARTHPSSTNAVLTVHAMAAQADKAALAIFSTEELKAFLNIPSDYETGRNILVGLRLLPASEDEFQIAGASVRAEMPRKVIAELQRRSEKVDIELRTSDLSEEHRTTLLAALLMLRINLARQVLSQFVGQQYGDHLMLSFEDSVKDIIDYFYLDIETFIENQPSTSLDFLYICKAMAYGGIEPKSQEEYTALHPFMTEATKRLGLERVVFFEALLSLLRSAAQPNTTCHVHMIDELI